LRVPDGVDLVNFSKHVYGSEGRKRVAELLKSFKKSEEHNKRVGRSYYDLSWMWGQA
jgi:hypothetical protein